MNSSHSSGRMSRKTYQLTGTAILAAIVVVLTILCNFIRFGPFSITLALPPMVIGAAIFGAGAGATLGFAFGLVVVVTGLLGWDGGTVVYLMGINAFATVLLCLLKGTAAGWVAGLVYRALEKKNRRVGVYLAGVVCPIVNTGIFILGMLVFFSGALSDWVAAAGSADMMSYIIFTLTGVNFLLELAVNVVLGSGIARIIQVVQKQRG